MSRGVCIFPAVSASGSSLNPNGKSQSMLDWFAPAAGCVLKAEFPEIRQTFSHLSQEPLSWCERTAQVLNTTTGTLNIIIAMIYAR